MADQDPKKKRTRRTKSEVQAKMSAIRVSMIEALGEVQRKHPSVSIGIIIVGTGGPNGKLMGEWGTNNRSAVKGVLEGYFDQEFIEEDEEVDDETDSGTDDE